MNDLAVFLNALPDGIVAVSEQNVVLFANAAVYDTLGVLPNSITGLPLSDCLKDQNLMMQLDKTGHESFLTLEADVNYPRKLRLRIKIVPLMLCFLPSSSSHLKEPSTMWNSAPNSSRRASRVLVLP